MNVGDRFSLGWKHPHLLEATVLELQRDRVLCEVVHRCPLQCFMWEFRNTMPMSGQQRLRYDDLGNPKLWVPMAPADAVALPGSVGQVKSYALTQPSKPVRRVRVLDPQSWRAIVEVAREQQGTRT